MAPVDFSPASLPYRPGTGVMLLNSKGEVFVGRRIDTTMEAWQMPQGGIDEGESEQDCAFRELKEEIGTDKARIIARTKGWLSYDLPDQLVGKVWGGKYRGQKQIWFLMRFLGQDSDINIATEHPEFRAWRWMNVTDLEDLIVPFKKDLYRSVLKEFSPHLQEYQG